MEPLQTLRVNVQSVRERDISDGLEGQRDSLEEDFPYDNFLVYLCSQTNRITPWFHLGSATMRPA